MRRATSGLGQHTTGRAMRALGIGPATINAASDRRLLINDRREAKGIDWASLVSMKQIPVHRAAAFAALIRRSRLLRADQQARVELTGRPALVTAQRLRSLRARLTQQPSFPSSPNPQGTAQTDRFEDSFNFPRVK
jgi:hypothetical protein